MLIELFQQKVMGRKTPEYFMNGRLLQFVTNL